MADSNYTQEQRPRVISIAHAEYWVVVYVGEQEIHSDHRLELEDVVRLLRLLGHTVEEYEISNDEVDAGWKPPHAIPGDAND